MPIQYPTRSSAGQALTRIWFRSCSASCLSCSSSLMAPGPWGGVGGGWGPREGGWGRQLLAAGPRPGGCRAGVRPEAAGKKGGKAELKTTGRTERWAERGRRRWPRSPRQNPGPLPRRCGLGIADFPNLPPAPRKRSGKCKRKRRGNPSLGQKPRRVPATGTGGGREVKGVESPFKTDQASAPPTQAPPN